MFSRGKCGQKPPSSCKLPGLVSYRQFPGLQRQYTRGLHRKDFIYSYPAVALSSSPPAIEAVQLFHRYGEHVALAGLDLRIESGEIFALLGKNGSGKTTFFSLLSTLLPVTEGKLSVCGSELPLAASDVRRHIGVVFQHPSCDRKLTVRENLRCQAALFGLTGAAREGRISQVTAELGLSDRLDWRLEKLSGGLQRRVDIAKSMLHAPRVLILDEPSTGLDPAARLDLWHALVGLVERHGVTLLLTTHLLEEAEKAQRIGILQQGKLVAVGNPNALRDELGDRVLVVEVKDNNKPAVEQWLSQQTVQFDWQDNQVRLSGERIADIIAPLVHALGPSIGSVTLGKPSLEDVFVMKTGHRFWDAAETVAPAPRSRRR